jgi:hypothetical protein
VIFIVDTAENLAPLLPVVEEMIDTGVWPAALEGRYVLS